LALNVNVPIVNLIDNSDIVSPLEHLVQIEKILSSEWLKRTGTTRCNAMSIDEEERKKKEKKSIGCSTGATRDVA